MAGSKYSKYVLKEPKGSGPPPRKPPTAQGISLGEKGLQGIAPIDCNFNFVGILSAHVLADPPHKHDVDEILFFISTEPGSADLGGEVEVALGEDWEKHVITTPAVICLPAGVQHAPIYVKRVDRPFYFGHCLMAASYGSSATPAPSP